MFWLIQLGISSQFLSTQSVYKIYSLWSIAHYGMCTSMRISAKDIGCDLRGNGSEVEFNRFLYWVLRFFNIDSEKKKENGKTKRNSAVYARFQMGKFNLSLRFNELKPRDTWENLSWVALAIFIISTSPSSYAFEE